MTSSLLARVERARASFRQDVADQLQMAAKRAGVIATVTLDRERAVLELEGTFSDGARPRVIAVFNDDRDGELGGSDGLILGVETSEDWTTLLTLAWRDDPGQGQEEALERRLAELEARTDERLPLVRRGLN